MAALYANQDRRASSAPVDVLAVMDRWIADSRLREFTDCTVGAKDATHEAEAARAAVAVLIGACKGATCQCPGGAWRTVALPYGRHQHDCHLAGIPAALARIGGAA
jgi:hypothetical protein